MSMTVLELREYVRDHLDSDALELPDTLLDVYRVEGTDRFQLGSQRWSFFENEFTFSTTASDQTYPLSGFTVATTSPVGTAVLREVMAVEGPQWVLDPLGHEEARSRFASSDSTGRPRWWSQYGSTLYLWPVPVGIESMRVRGYRGPVVTSASSDYPDLPGEFHVLIGQWMLARAYQQMDDDRMANQFFAAVEGQFSVLRERYESPSRAGVSVMGGKARGPVVGGGRPLYPWE